MKVFQIRRTAKSQCFSTNCLWLLNLINSKMSSYTTIRMSNFDSEKPQSLCLPPNNFASHICSVTGNILGSQLWKLYRNESKVWVNAPRKHLNWREFDTGTFFGFLKCFSANFLILYFVLHGSESWINNSPRLAQRQPTSFNLSASPMQLLFFSIPGSSQSTSGTQAWGLLRKGFAV